MIHRVTPGSVFAVAPAEELSVDVTLSVSERGRRTCKNTGYCSKGKQVSFTRAPGSACWVT